MSASARASRFLFSVERHAFRAEKWICIISLVAMLVGISFSVAVRYFNLHLPDTGDGVNPDPESSKPCSRIC